MLTCVIAVVASAAIVGLLMAFDSAECDEDFEDDIPEDLKDAFHSHDWK